MKDAELYYSRLVLNLLDDDPGMPETAYDNLLKLGESLGMFRTVQGIKDTVERQDDRYYIEPDSVTHIEGCNLTDWSNQRNEQA